MLLHRVHSPYDGEDYNNNPDRYWPCDCPENPRIYPWCIRQMHAKIGREEGEWEEDDSQGSEY